ncbi:MAG: proline dehydrogenase family protein [Nitriliruptorales bacterium]|nr:proline dehydrogenase family protein [Nitriliruptorales bacterium]
MQLGPKTSTICNAGDVISAALRHLLARAARSEALRQLAEDAPVASAVAHRFVAGRTLAQAVDVTRNLNAAGFSVALDHLGEAVTDETEARRAAATYRRVLERVREQGLDASISVKPSQMGVDIAVELAAELIGSLADDASAIGTHVTLDMESSAHTQVTIDLVLSLRAVGHANVGCAVQSMLFRTAADVDALIDAGASLRLCKGAYAEPPAVAHQDGLSIAVSYVRLADRLLKGEGLPRFATHDKHLVDRLLVLSSERGRGPGDREWQMLYGVREVLQRELLDAGERVRIYVPFGDQWYPYLVRRMAERPANLLLFLRALVGRRA